VADASSQTDNGPPPPLMPLTARPAFSDASASTPALAHAESSTSPALPPPRRLRPWDAPPTATPGNDPALLRHSCPTISEEHPVAKSPKLKASTPSRALHAPSSPRAPSTPPVRAPQPAAAMTPASESAGLLESLKRRAAALGRAMPLLLLTPSSTVAADAIPKAVARSALLTNCDATSTARRADALIDAGVTAAAAAAASTAAAYEAANARLTHELRASHAELAALRAAAAAKSAKMGTTPTAEPDNASSTDASALLDQVVAINTFGRAGSLWELFNDSEGSSKDALRVLVMLGNWLSWAQVNGGLGGWGH
jgi:hypothetical protein